MNNISDNISSQIEYICGSRWNKEYNKWLVDFCKYSNGFNYHYMAKIKWNREFSKLPENCDWAYISSHPNITWDIIKANPGYQWDWYAISSHPNITWDIIQANPDSPWNWRKLACHPNITWDIIQKNPYKPWDWEWVSRNPNITWDIIKANPGYQWDWYAISSHPNITWDIIQANPDKPWHWHKISENPNITLENIITHDWYFIIYYSKNVNVLNDIVNFNNIRKIPWFKAIFNWNKLYKKLHLIYLWFLCDMNIAVSQNPHITWDISQSNPDINWDWNFVSRNSSVTWEIINANPNKSWSKDYLIANKLTAQAKLSLAKFQIKAHRETNYLARYISCRNHRLLSMTLEYGY